MFKNIFKVVVVARGAGLVAFRISSVVKFKISVTKYIIVPAPRRSSPSRDGSTG